MRRSALSSLNRQCSSSSNPELMRSATSLSNSFLSTIMSRASSMRSSQGDMRDASTSPSARSQYAATHSASSARWVERGSGS